MTYLETANKEQLRAACRAAGISYSKLTNAGMREALQAYTNKDLGIQAVVETDEDGLEAELEEDGDIEGTGETSVAETVVEAVGEAVGESRSLILKNHTNRKNLLKSVYLRVTAAPQLKEDSTMHSVAIAQKTPILQQRYGKEIPFVCSPEKAAQKAEVDEVVEKVQKTPGIRRPIKGVCADVWAALDKMIDPTIKEIKIIGEEKGWNSNNVQIEFYQWRKYNGFSGRCKK